MPQPNLFYDYSKRDYLLPTGCKNLIDVLNQSPSSSVLKQSKPPKSWPDWSFYSPQTGVKLREVWIPKQITVRELAQILGLKPFRIIAYLMADLKMFKNIEEILDFEVAAKASSQFGFKAQQLPL